MAFLAMFCCLAIYSNMFYASYSTFMQLILWYYVTTAELIMKQFVLYVGI